MKRMHPVVNAMYFLLIIVFSMIVSHPILIVVLLICAAACVINSKGLKSSAKYLIYIIPLALITAIINPMFSHEGITVLTELPGGNMLTLESISFGLGMALKLMTIFIWFIYINDVMTSDKIMYLLGAFAPYIANTFSMILRFIPKLTEHIRQVRSVRKVAYQNVQSGVVQQNRQHGEPGSGKRGPSRGRLREGVNTLSSSITWIIDDSIDTANSMRCRGYAAQRRISYSIFRFSLKDLEWMILLAAIYIVLFVLNYNKVFYWQYYPYIKSGQINPYFIIGAVLIMVSGVLPLFDKTERNRR